MKKLIDIKVCSKSEAQIFSSDKPWAAISISTDPEEFPFLDDKNREGLLQLSFMDISDVNPETSKYADRLISDDQAKQIIAFVDEVLPKIETLVVHCEAGWCRSPAIAAAVSCYLWGNGMDVVYFKKYNPNIYVYRTILKQFEQDADKVANERLSSMGQKIYEEWDCNE